MKEKLKIAIVGGGPSDEHKVSCASAKNVYKFIDRKKYSPHLLLLKPNKKLLLDRKQLPFPQGLKQFDIIFNALHGKFGEDGEFQEILDRNRIKYTGSGARASRLGMDKWLSKKLFKNAGLAVPKAKLLESLSGLGVVSFPAIIKPRTGGSSIGVSIVNSIGELKKEAQKIIKNDQVIVEEYLPGREFTVGILQKKDKLIALPVIEIKPAAKYEFFDYEAKYKTGASKEIVPALIKSTLVKKVQTAAIRAHGAIGAKTYSRSDFILFGDKFYILEINTLPGLTKNSLIPKAARSVGISFPQLIDIIIRGAY